MLVLGGVLFAEYTLDVHVKRSDCKRDDIKKGEGGQPLGTQAEGEEMSFLTLWDTKTPL